MASLGSEITWLAEWVNRYQEHISAYLQEKVRVQKKLDRGKRLHVSDEQRCRLAAKAKKLRLS